jgi:MSHA biogenesis protein MshN
VRAVPDRRTVHPAWWITVALAITLLAVVTWVLLRPPAADPYLVRAQLPLKLEVDLGAAAEAQPLPPPVPISEAASSSSSAPAPVAPEPILAAADIVPVPAPSVAVAEVAAPRPPALVAASAPDAKASTAVAPLAPSSRPAATPTAAAEPDDEPTAQPVTKQMRALTPLQRAENEFREATLAMQQGRKSEALAGFEQVLLIDAKHAGARQALIAVLLDDGRTDEAMRNAREGLELDARQAGLAMILARLQLEKNDLRGALGTLERARPYAAERADYVAFHAALLQRDERHKDAVEQYMLALRKMPQNGLWWMGLGISLQAERRNAEAQEAYRRARASNVLSPELAAFVDSRLAQLR